MAFNLDTLIVDRVRRGTLFDKTTSDVIFSATQIINPSLEVAGEQVFANDAVGVRIAAFDRNKTASFSAENTQINLGIMAAQFGSAKQIATTASKLVAPKFEEFTVGETTGAVNTTITLTETPSGTVPFIYRLGTGSNDMTKYPLDTAASPTKFSISEKVITLPTPTSPDTIVATDRFVVWYNYDAEDAVKISSDADKFALGGKFDLEVVFADVCNPNTKYYGHIIYPSVKMNPGFSLSFTTEGTHSFGFEALADYCSVDKNLFYFIIPE